jgi:hypothetical protein
MVWIVESYSALGTSLFAVVMRQFLRQRRYAENRLCRRCAFNPCFCGIRGILLCITEVPISVPGFENDCPHLDFSSSYIIFQHPVPIRKLQYHLIFSLYATFNMIFVSIISTLHYGAYRPSSGVNRALFTYANILKAMAVGHFSYRPKFACCNGDRHEQNLLKCL